MVMSWESMVVLMLSVIPAAGGPLWQVASLAFSVALFFITLLVLTIVLYVAGLVVVGKRRALFSDAFMISLIGTLVSTSLLMFIPYSLVSLLLSIVAWLLLVKRFYGTGWLGSISVSVLVLTIFVSIVVITSLVFGLFETVFKLLLDSSVSIV